MASLVPGRRALSRTVLLALGTACSAPAPGGLTADVHFGAAPVAGRRHHSLRTAAVPRSVHRLSIRALTTDGATVAATNLWAQPEGGQTPLLREGGAWTLTEVPADVPLILVGDAHFGPHPVAELDQARLFSGRIDGISVRPGEISHVGDLVLEATGARIPELDFAGPDIDRPRIRSTPEGDGLTVTLSGTRPGDLGGYAIFVGASTATTAPPLVRSAALEVGDRWGDFELAAVIRPPDNAVVRGFAPGRRVAVAVVPFDLHWSGAPLNFGAPHHRVTTIRDTLPPGAIREASLELDDDVFVVRFLAPEEDGAADGQGLVPRYALAAHPDDPTAQPASVNILDSTPPGGATELRIPAARLGWSTDTPLQLAAWPVDAAGNAGPKTTLASAGRTPRIEATIPEVPRSADDALILSGRHFGAATGAVHIEHLEGSTSLVVAAWTPTQVEVRVPAEARGGTLVLTRADGVATRRAQALLQPSGSRPVAGDGPLAVVSVGDARAPTALILREQPAPPGYDAEAFRIAPGDEAVTALRAESYDQAARCIAPLYAPEDDDGWFLVGRSDDQSHLFRVAGDPLAPAQTETWPGVLAASGTTGCALVGSTDGVRFAVLDRAGGIEVWRQDGGAFAPFADTATTGAHFDSPHAAKDESGRILLAFRAERGGESRLRLAQLWDPARPELRLSSADGALGGRQPRVVSIADDEGPSFVIAYESGPTAASEVRLLRWDDFGARSGVAPLARDERLQSLGGASVVTTAAGARVAVLILLRAPDETEVRYLEVSPEDIDRSEDAALAGPGTALGTFPTDVRTALHCQPAPATGCVLYLESASSGDNALYFRRPGTP